MLMGAANCGGFIQLYVEFVGFFLAHRRRSESEGGRGQEIQYMQKYWWDASMFLTMLFRAASPPYHILTSLSPHSPPFTIHSHTFSIGGIMHEARRRTKGRSSIITSKQEGRAWQIMEGGWESASQSFCSACPCLFVPSKEILLIEGMKRYTLPLYLLHSLHFPLHPPPPQHLFSLHIPPS